MYVFKMNKISNFPDQLPCDEAGYRFDPRVRASLEQFSLEGNLNMLEAASALRAAAHAIDTLRSRGATGQGLSAGSIGVLLQLDLGHDQDLRVSDLSALLGVSPRNVTGLVDTLERDGLVKRAADINDRRAVRVNITAAGSEVVQALRKPTQLAMNAVFHGFTPDGLVQLRHLCLQLTENAKRIQAGGEQR
jgi:DNA-binding MarR family transcriptional regulator